MSTKLKGEFETRREAEMAVERLVQEYGIDRGRVVVVASGARNSAGEECAGSDLSAGDPTPQSREDAALNGAITVSVDLEDDAVADKVRDAFAEFDASVVQGD